MIQMELTTLLSNALPSLWFPSWSIIPLVTAARSQRVLLLLIPHLIGPYVFLTQLPPWPLDLALYSSAPFSLTQFPSFLAGITGSLSCILSCVFPSSSLPSSSS